MRLPLLGGMAEDRLQERQLGVPADERSYSPAKAARTHQRQRANEHLPPLLGLPEGLPVLTFAGRARFGTAHWKVDAIDEYAGDQPLAWIDDNLDETCTAWAARREAPTLLVPTESDRGLEEAHVDALVDWVERGYDPR